MAGNYAATLSGADMTPRIPENFSTWLAGWNLVTVMRNTPPPRDPNDNDEEEDEDDNNDEQNDDRDPAVIRDPEGDEERRATEILGNR
jgi:hypothetical protein